MTRFPVLIILASIALGSLPQQEKDRKALHFVTEPNIRAISLTVTEHDPKAIAPGYWFVAPLVNSKVPLPEDREYAPLKTGAQIYNRNGDLVWSMQDQPMPQVHSFQPVYVNGSQQLTLVVQQSGLLDAGRLGVTAGIVMNDHFEQIARVVTKGENIHQDFHEFHLDHSGRTAIVAARFLSNHNEKDSGNGNSGFQEIDLLTGEGTFQWNALSAGVGFDESHPTVQRLPPRTTTTATTPDFFHLNSVDKDADGDYLVSARHTSTIYKISRIDGSIIWRLGGTKSDFTLTPDVTFHFQHDARFRFENSTHTIISLLDNAVPPHKSRHEEEHEQHPQTPQSFGKIILLNHDTRSATLLRHFPRPHNLPSRKMGNLQTLGKNPLTSNVLINWASPSGISEFDSRNRLILDASLAGGTVTSYRVFKAPFVGRPLRPPVMTVLPAVHGWDGKGRSATFYMSWNGATDVRGWRICISNDEEVEGTFEVVAEISKRGFETAWSLVSGKSGQRAFVEAIDASGDVLGKSETSQMPGWHGEQEREQEDDIDTGGAHWALRWTLYAWAMYGLWTAAHQTLVLYRRAGRRRGGGYKLLQ